MEAIFEEDLKFNHMSDLGCGTGLSGIVFRDCTAKLTGIDLSAKMLQEVAQKNSYDNLMLGDVIQVLDAIEDSFDFFLATDLMIYLQDLHPLFKAIKNRSTPGAIFAFSTESTDIDDYVLKESGRTAHIPNYIHSLTKMFNIDIVEEKRMPIRKDHEKWTEGDLFICRLS